MSDKDKIDSSNGSVEGSLNEIEVRGVATLNDEEKKDLGNGIVDGSVNDIEAPAPASPTPASNAVPNGGLTAWLQVVGSFFLMMNSW